MLGKILVAVVRFALSKARISVEQRSQLSLLVLDRLVALPLRDIIKYDAEGRLLVSGRRVELEEAAQLREGAIASLNNYAHRIVYEQITFAALKGGAYASETVQDQLFFRAATWWGQEETKILTLLAGAQERDLTP